MSVRRLVRAPVAKALCGAAVLLFVLSLPASASAQSQGTERIRGSVTDPEGNPVEGVRVVLTHVASGDTYEVTTGDSGRWTKGSVGGGDWTIDFFKEGYAPEGINFHVRRGIRNPTIDITLEPGNGAPPGEDAPAIDESIREPLNEGNALYDAGDFEAALETFEALLAAHDEPPAEDEEPAEAEATTGAEEMVAPGQDGFQVYLVHLNAGNAALELDRHDVALDHYRELLAHDPDNVQAQIGVAKVYLDQRAIDEAVAALEKIEISEITDPIIFYNVGSLLFDQGQSEEAARYYELALELDPEFADAHFQLALSYVQMGDTESARTHFERVVEIAPDSQNAALARDFLQSI